MKNVFGRDTLFTMFVKARISAVLAGLLFCTGITTVSGYASSGYVDDGWITPDLPIQGYVNVTFSENVGGSVLSPGSPYLIWRGNQVGGMEESAICSSLNDVRCAGKMGSLTYMTRLTQCRSVNDLDCIEDLILLKDEKAIQGKVNDLFPKTTRTTYTSDPFVRLPKASSGQTWYFPNFTHAGGELFFVNAILAGSKEASANRFSPISLSLNINAIDFKRTTRDDGASYVNENKGSFGTKIGAVGVYPPYENERYNCVMSGDNLCANRRELPEGIEFRVSLRLSASPSGWLHGRINEASIDVEDLDASDAVRIVITGKPQRIPVMGFSYPWKEIPKAIQAQYLGGEFSNEGGGFTKGCRWCSEDPLINTLTSNPLSYGPDALQEFQAWIKVRDDRADADLNSWSVRTLSENEMADTPACFARKNQLSGFVTTNSTIYSAGPPKLVEGSLNYEVAAPHLRSNGEETRGQYRLIVRSDVARCVYGFSKAPISATVSVTNSGGQQQVATTSVNEKNGWLTLSASNFTYSTPTIRVVLEGTKEQPDVIASPTPTPVVTSSPTPIPSQSPTPQASPSVSAKKPLILRTICVKGKITKVVTGAKCPSGYKKK